VQESANVRQVREFYEVWNSGDVEGVADVPADFDFHLRHDLPDLPEHFHGPAGMRELWELWFSGPWEGTLSIEVRHLIEIDDERVLALTIFSGTGAGSGVPVSVPYTHLFYFKDGLPVRGEGWVGWKEALRAVGLDEVPDTQ
jgi:hypothetical protein